MSKIAFADKSQIGSYDATKGNAQDWNEVKDSVNALYDNPGSGIYTVLRGIVTQQGTSAPVLTIQENSTGRTFAFTYSAVGEYILTPSALVAANKQHFKVGNSQLGSVNGNINIVGQQSGGLQFAIYSLDVVTGLPVNDALFNTPIELIVYN
jgi:hypothetical protein